MAIVRISIWPRYQFFTELSDLAETETGKTTTATRAKQDPGPHTHTKKEHGA